MSDLFEVQFLDKQEKLVGFSKKIDPNNAFEGVKVDHIAEMCGIIPHIFVRACVTSDETLDSVAKRMDEGYGFGGFSVSVMKGSIKKCRYISSFKEDDPMDAMVVLIYKTEDERRILLYIFQSGIIGLMDSSTGQTKIARFD